MSTRASRVGGRGRALYVLQLIAVAGMLFAADAGAQSADEQLWRGKVAPSLLERIDEGSVEFLVILAEQAELSQASSMPTKGERGRLVFRELSEVAARTQSPLIDLLDSLGAEYRSFWITNMIWVRGAPWLLEAIATRADVKRLDANPEVSMEAPLAASAVDGGHGGGAIEWNVTQIHADQLWAMGYTGRNVVIGGQDTGYAWDHPALIEQYRGRQGLGADHNYSWHDAIHSLGSDCGANSVVPCDDHNHGTHTMGTMVGDDGVGNRIGVAPDARWIGCRNMKDGDGTPATYAECFQWFVAPTDLLDANPDPSKAPHVINNSWSCPDSEGCSFDTLRTVVENTRAAGIVVVGSAGNDGSSCGSVSNPPAIYDATFSVGATDASDQIAGFSSRGPVTVDSSGRIKPDISAPGVGVRSSVNGASFSSFSGTSMAGPHVAAVVALLLEARPDLAGQVESIETILREAAWPLAAGQSCGGVDGSEIPNNTYGYGRLDAVEVLLGDADGDGLDNLSDCRPTDSTLWSEPQAVSDLLLTGDDPTQLLWSAPSDAGSSDPRYDLLRATLPDLTGASCIETALPAPFGEDGSVPAELFVYQIRVTNPCGTALGSDSTGIPRSAEPCP